jgi:siroheme synthase
VPYEVVPGITAAAGCAASIGLPLTHRGVAKGVHFVTGHVGGNAELDLNWHGLADPDTTLVVYMGLAHVTTICTELQAAGLAPETPAVAVANGTTPAQRVCPATLATLAEVVSSASLEAPVLVVIGRVAGLIDALGLAPGDVEPALARVGSG